MVGICDIYIYPLWLSLVKNTAQNARALHCKKPRRKITVLGDGQFFTGAQRSQRSKFTPSSAVNLRASSKIPVNRNFPLGYFELDNAVKFRHSAQGFYVDTVKFILKT